MDNCIDSIPIIGPMNRLCNRIGCWFRGYHTYESVPPKKDRCSHCHKSGFFILLVLVAFVLFLAVGATIVWYIAKLAQRLLPNEPGITTNNVINWSTNTTDNPPSPLPFPPPNTNPVSTNGAGIAFATNFTVQYGLSDAASVGVLLPWCSPGTNLTQSVDGVANTVVSIDGLLWISVGYSGSTLEEVISDSGGNATTEFETNWPSQTVLLLRSTNLIEWEPVYTNAACGVDTVEQWTDTNCPPDAAFYSVKY